MAEQAAAQHPPADQPASAAIELRGVGKSFGTTHVLSGIDL